jgi:S-adenosylmethionine:tRNA ribosyltransferase-isomerase
MSLRTADYNYSLPDELVARYPAISRDGSRMMLLDRAKQQITHLRFGDFVDLVHPTELVVLNDTRVIPARIRLPDRNAEILLLEEVDPSIWRCLVRPGKSFAVGRTFSIEGRLIKFDGPVDLDKIGEMPLPPYIARASEGIDRERYQTVYAARTGAIAAPTAGLHFTPGILARLPHEFVTLHVGVGTFKPVKAEVITEHRLHREEFELTEAAADNIQSADRILAVGTTTVRTLETLMQRFNRIRSGKGVTDIFIYPPFRFRRANSLLTNFHLPKSTLLMLVAAFAGREFILEAYREAVKERYRFFSYGDCMLIR